MSNVRVADIVAELGGELRGDAARQIDRIATLQAATASAISFLANPRYRAQLASTQAGCVIVAPDLAGDVPASASAIVTPDPYLYYARLTQWWAARGRGARASGVHPSAVVEPGAVIGEGACVGALTYIGAGAVVGAGTRIAARVVVGERCVIGERCIVHAGVVTAPTASASHPPKDAGRRSSSSARCASAPTSRSVPTPASTVVRWTTP